MGWGYTTYTLGFFLGQVLFFPLMYHGWNLDIATVVDHQSQPLTKPIFASPFMLAFGAALLVLIFRPYSLLEQKPEPATEKGRKSSHNAADIFRSGGIAFITMLLVGSCVSFVIFHIDTFAGPDLLPGSTVKQKTLGLGILCFATFVMVGIFSWRLEADKRFRTLSPAARSGVLACNLAITVLLLGLIVLKGNALGWLGVAVVLGLSSGFVNMLPQVVKWAILDSAAIEDKAKASAILGIAKRVPNLVFSATIVTFEAARLDTPDFAYKLLIGAILVAIAALAIYYSRVQRYALTIDYPSDKQLAIEGVLAASISDVPNTMLEESQHLPTTNGKAHLNLSIYSTSREYVSQILRALRHQGAVSRVEIKRSGKLS
jgi:MFS family permease